MIRWLYYLTDDDSCGCGFASLVFITMWVLTGLMGPCLGY